MANNAGNTYQQMLGNLAAGVQRRDESTLTQILDLLRRQPGDPNLLHLAGLYHLNNKAFDTAIDYFQQSLTTVAEQPELHNNLANAYRAVGDLAAAQKHYEQATRLQPKFTDAHKNLGLLFLQQDKFEEAEQALKNALQISPQDFRVLTGLGDVYKAQDGFDQASECYSRALAIAPTYANALHSLASCHKALERPDSAMSLYQKAQKAAPEKPEIDLSIGNLLFDLGEYQQAEAQFLNAIEKAPQMVEAHETLSELYWQTGRHEEIDNSYAVALRAEPNNMAMRLSLLKLLISSGQQDAGKQLAEESLAIKELPELYQLQGKLYANELDYVRADENFRLALRETKSLDWAQDLVKLKILQAEYQAALSLLDSLQHDHPNDQLSWALKGLCWRLIGDERYQWLIDYQAHVKSYSLPSPNGYKSLQSFLEELERTLLNMHSTKFAPSQQTLKGGTQTPGRLLHKNHPVIQSYKHALTEVIGDYISSLPTDDDHPLLGRKGTGFEFSGSWSVKLAPGGFHVNHVHPQGWISSACYITMPECDVNDGASPACIKFGESGLGLGDREIVERIVQPEAGMLVLFPSYTWHGTYEFSAPSDEFRLTAPFDVVPL